MDLKLKHITLPKKIIVHGGNAHRDDFLSCCLALTCNKDALILRKLPLQIELEDPKIWVIDTGLSHDPELNNFDHHQLTADNGSIVCSISLVLTQLALYWKACSYFPWLGYTEYMDNFGATAAAKKYAIPESVMAMIESPIETALLEEFAGTSEVAPGEVLHRMMTLIGWQIRSAIEEIQVKFKLFDQHVKEQKHEAGTVLLLPLDIGPNPTKHLSRWIDYEKKQGVIGVVCYDEYRKGSHYALRRHNGSPSVDLNRLVGQPGVAFVHATGLVASVKAHDLQEAYDNYMRVAVV